MRQRRASMDETRARIVDAALELYEAGGPASTTMSAVAERAGVTRATLYRHFPTEADVADVVIEEWGRGAGIATAAALAAVADPAARLRAALVPLYGGYRATEAITANLLRDAHALPEARRGDLRAPAARTREVLLGSGLPWRGAATAEAALDHSLAFETWRSLAAAGLGDDTIADLMVGLVTLAASGGPRAGRGRTAAVAAPATSARHAAGEPARAGSASPTPAVPAPAATRAKAARTAAKPARPSPAAPKPAVGAPAAPAPAPATAPAVAPPAAAPASPAAATAPAGEHRRDKGAEKAADKGAGKAGKGGAKAAAKAKAGKKGKGDRKAKGKGAGGG